MLRHLHPGDWLGRPDSLTLRASVGGGGTYHNPLVDEREHCIEPWSGIMECYSDRGAPTTELRVEVSLGVRGLITPGIPVPTSGNVNDLKKFHPAPSLSLHFFVVSGFLSRTLVKLLNGVHSAPIP